MIDEADLQYLRNINTKPGPNAGRSIDPTRPGPDDAIVTEESNYDPWLVDDPTKPGPDDVEEIGTPPRFGKAWSLEKFDAEPVRQAPMTNEERQKLCTDLRNASDMNTTHGMRIKAADELERLAAELDAMMWDANTQYGLQEKIATEDRDS